MLGSCNMILIAYWHLVKARVIIDQEYATRVEGKILTGSLCNLEKSQMAHVLYFLTPKAIGDIYPTD